MHGELPGTARFAALLDRVCTRWGMLMKDVHHAGLNGSGLDSGN
jgi:hypothetical protein